ncbi:MAG TPA: hypothetical protein P5313_09935, partial [Spirochaetia bacterium]|nr:hypothetical protein [Spirochaetia bacterium]
MVPTFRRRGRPAVPFRSVSAALVLAAFASAAAAQDIRLFPGVPEPPVVNARSVVVLEAARGRILYERDADIPIPPASLTKLMTLRVLYK